MWLLPGNSFRNIHPFIFSFMCQHGTFNHITYGIYAWHCSFKVIVYRDFIASFFSFNSYVFQSQSISISCTAYCNDTVICFKFYFFTFGVIGRYRNFFTFNSSPCNFMTHEELHAQRFLQYTLQFFS
ncbi:hypothetical protein D3C87_1852990 [compost metagenome]